MRGESFVANNLQGSARLTEPARHFALKTARPFSEPARTPARPLPKPRRPFSEPCKLFATKLSPRI